MGRLIIYSRETLLNVTSQRKGEVKLGERLQVLSSLDDLHKSSCKFVLIGLPEDVGVKANFGITGTRTAWLAALNALCNIQSTDRFSGGEIAVLGHIDFSSELQRAAKLDAAKESELEKLRDLVGEIDEQVYDLILRVFSSGKVPIIIGGGHNNAYPVIKALSTHQQSPVNVINIDAHADFRALEGRHSGNGFSYALREKYLGKYAVLGLHENYNSQGLINELKELKEQVLFIFFDDLVREDNNYDRAFLEALNFTQGVLGLEIDADSIAGTLSSAASPSGFTVNQVRNMIAASRIQDMSYLHIAEAAATLADGRENSLCGKTIAFLISDFVKAQR